MKWKMNLSLNIIQQVLHEKMKRLDWLDWIGLTNVYNRK